MSDEQSQKEIEELFEKNVEFLVKNVAPDDIYCFAEGLLSISYYFLRKWSKHVDLADECEKEETTNIYVQNLLRYFYARDQELELKYRLGIYQEDDDF